VLKNTLMRPRTHDIILHDVLEMKHKVETAHPPRDAWHMKYRVGGMVSIEFACQYLQLMHAQLYPHVIQGNTLSSLRALIDLGIMEDACRILIEAHTLWQTLQNLLRLTLGSISPKGYASHSLNQKLAQLCNVTTIEEAHSHIETMGARAAKAIERIFCYRCY
jgi:[glutamine synthetase] adenylyltransferase / [glutamine synthetase]-adenylyl-L-tyrosine phosphorylase